ncbi:hypothetical protein HUU61_00700 [Rhodopseudomonas palustris]|nr:hypothetical protein [Rhodopseudomonas palustris]
MPEINPENDKPAYLLALADVLDDADESTLAVTDSGLCAEALRHYAAYLDSVAP